jgi:type I restriction enzyme R subunit
MVNSMTEFKQIIGRGTRVREDKDKLFFTILDYTGSATRNFADPDFDGEPPLVTSEEIDENGKVLEGTFLEERTETPPADWTDEQIADLVNEDDSPRKYYVTEGEVTHRGRKRASIGRQRQTAHGTIYPICRRAGFYPVYSMAEDLPDSMGPIREERNRHCRRTGRPGSSLERLSDIAKMSDARSVRFALLCGLRPKPMTRRERADRCAKQQHWRLLPWEPENGQSWTNMFNLALTAPRKRRCWR